MGKLRVATFAVWYLTNKALVDTPGKTTLAQEEYFPYPGSRVTLDKLKGQEGLHMM